MEVNRQRILKFAIVIMLNVCVIALVGLVCEQNGGFKTAATQTLSGRGSTGPEVEAIQQRLSTWGYFSGRVNGVFGNDTEEAVRYFQRKNGIPSDGVAGSATLAALGLPVSPEEIGYRNDPDWQLLARIISSEARGEPYEGQVAVGAVVLNRVEHPSFPDSVAEVVYQPGAFTAINDGQIDEPIADSSFRAAKDALNGWDPSGGALYYYNPDKTDNKWMIARPVIVRIGAHLFCD